MDEEAMERFYALPESDLKEDILQHIQKKQDGYYFMNRPDGSCMMLDPDGLCRIQRNSREEMLCITCRKFPRLAGRVQQDYWILPCDSRVSLDEDRRLVYDRWRNKSGD